MIKKILLCAAILASLCFSAICVEGVLTFESMRSANNAQASAIVSRSAQQEKLILEMVGELKALGSKDVDAVMSKYVR